MYIFEKHTKLIKYDVWDLLIMSKMGVHFKTTKTLRNLVRNFNKNSFYHTPTGNIIWLSCLLLINVNFMAPRAMQFAPCHLIYSDNIHFFCSKFFCEFYAIIKVSHHVKNRKRCICVPNNNALRLHEFGT